MVDFRQKHRFITYPATFKPWLKWSIFLFLLILYYAFAPWMYVNIGTVSRLFAFFYVIPAALFWGGRTGIILTAISTAPVGFVHLLVVGEASEGGLIGPVFAIIIAGLVGYLRDLSLSLEEELARREGVELELLNLKTNLEEEVSKRTGELISANYELQDVINDRSAVEKQMSRLAMAIEQASEEVMITDVQGVIEYVNPAFERVTGYSRREAIGSKPSILKSGEHDLQFYKNLWETISRGQVWRGRFVNRSRNGSRLVEDATISPVYDSQGKINGYVSVKRDVTEFEKREAQNRQAQKMEAIGALAGGIAHDFNNILFGIFGYTEIAMRRAEDQPAIREALEEVMKGGRRAKDLVRQILTFSRQRDAKWQPVQVKLVIKEVLNLLRSVLPATVEIKQKVTSESMVLADPTQIHQVFMNLCTNAQYAMREKGGVLTVTLEDGKIDEEEIAETSDIKPGEYIVLTVEDTGHGIPEDVVARIFEPFFTTKGEGEGTGMGLSTTRNIVSDCGGAITVESTPGEGSTFRVLLPICRKDIREITVSTIGGLPGGKERVMVVDDEAPLVRMICEMLTGLGYSAKGFSSSSEALQAFTVDPQVVDLVVTDVTMPLLNGLELTGRLIRTRPSIPVIMVTGFSEVVDEAKARAAGVKGYLLKPISIRELAVTVRDVLDGKVRSD
ncbi:MAG: response regulator [Proteobacteria bacterium]|nr:response regulator [Pseudomonadota bacterium]MBU1736632.1 response regulator [Pseudomonadota bacterium]